jgi:hypothetical protein
MQFIVTSNPLALLWDGITVLIKRKYSGTVVNKLCFCLLFYYIKFNNLNIIELNNII